MVPHTDWNQFLYQLQQHIQSQDHRIRSLEEQVQNLVQLQDEKSGVTIEKVEYKFDQLKIETLSGSLHIGLSPEALEQIDDLGLGQVTQPHHHPPQPMTQNLSPFDQNILADLHQWCQTIGPQMIQQTAQQYKRHIDDSQQSLLLQDIQSQFPSRLLHYKKEAANESSIQTEQELKTFIIEKVQHEVNQSLDKYMKEQEEEEGE